MLFNKLLGRLLERHQISRQIQELRVKDEEKKIKQMARPSINTSSNNTTQGIHIIFILTYLINLGRNPQGNIQVSYCQVLTLHHRHF